MVLDLSLGTCPMSSVKNTPIVLMNCVSYVAGSEQQVEQPVDFQFAQTELMMNEMSSGAFLLPTIQQPSTS